MSPETAILRDLAAGQTTADSLALRLHLRTASTEVILRRMETEGTIRSKPLGGVLENVPVYYLPRINSPTS